MKIDALGLHHDSRKRQFTDPEGGYLRYRMRDPHTMDILSTYVPTEQRGKGRAGMLTRRALGYAREHQLKVVPTCPYTQAFMERNTEFRDLLER